MSNGVSALNTFARVGGFYRTLATTVATALLALLSTPAAAQESRTFSVKAETVTADGQQIGCSIVFAGGIQDDRDRVGQILSLDGSIMYRGYWDDRINPKLVLKLVVAEFDPSEESPSLTPSRPAVISLLATDQQALSSHKSAQIPGDDAGSQLAIYDIEAMSSVMERLQENGELGIAFNRREGGIDLHWNVPVPKYDALIPFLTCIRDISRNMQSELIE